MRFTRTNGVFSIVLGGLGTWVFHKYWWVAFTLPGLIVYMTENAFSRPDVRRHEYAHIVQMRKYRKYLWLNMLWEVIRYPYRSRPFENQARAAEHCGDYAAVERFVSGQIS